MSIDSYALAGRFSIAWGLVCWAMLAASARPIAGLFADEAAVVDVLALLLVVAPAGLGGQGLFMTASASFNAIGRPSRAAALAILRTPVSVVSLRT